MRKPKLIRRTLFVHNLMEGKSNMGYGMVLTEIFKKVKIDVRSKVLGMYKGDFDLVTQKRMKLLVIPLNKKFVVMGETAEKQFREKRLSISTHLCSRKERGLTLS